MKPQVPAFTVPQLPEAMDVLKQKASDLKIPLEVALPLDLNRLHGIKLGLAGDHQFINAGLAVALCTSWLHITGHVQKFLTNENQEAYLPEAFLKGLSAARLSGRAQIVHDTWLKPHKLGEMKETTYGDLIFYLDGAHSPESMEVCARWFSNAVKEERSSFVHLESGIHGNGYLQRDHTASNGSNKISKQILLFNCMDVRDPQVLLPRLYNTCASSGIHFSKALFVPSLSSYHKVDSPTSPVVTDTTKDLSWQFTLQRAWEKIIHGKDANVEVSCQMKNLEILPSQGSLHEDIFLKSKQFDYSAVMPSLPATLKWLRDCVTDNPSLRLQVLVTGSLHLVGDVLKLLRK